MTSPAWARREGDRWTYLGRTIDGADVRSFRVLDAHRDDLVLGHWSPNFDASGFALDRNVVFQDIDDMLRLVPRSDLNDAVYADTDGELHLDPQSTTTTTR